jgi:hypothetical protein
MMIITVTIFVSIWSLLVIVLVWTIGSFCIDFDGLCNVRSCTSVSLLFLLFSRHSGYFLSNLMAMICCPSLDSTDGHCVVLWR